MKKILMKCLVPKNMKKKEEKYKKRKNKGK